ncbi:hypothetical protein yberc0001_950 [Yersinia bercovieri ATCC 43970]|uniref:Uncharacterized protein n=1 Tax=Yersinia bercovieri ATCC 43970 TaxID=349968 RepID=A0ABP2E842_YERBE|nr:hypothetical protein yberc0001_950 [Yersinia bercovieri ATCC 43970]
MREMGSLSQFRTMVVLAAENRWLLACYIMLGKIILLSIG